MGPSEMAPLVQGIWLLQVHLAVLTNLENQVLLVVKRFTRHNRFWAESIRNPTLGREEIEQLDGI